MSKTFENIQRVANVTMAEAIAEISEKFPDAEVVSCIQRGNMYVAKIAMDDAPFAAPPAPNDPKEPEPAEPVDDAVGDLGDEDASEDKHIEKRLDKMEHLLHEVAKAVGVGGDEHGHEDKPGDDVVVDTPEEPLPPPVEENKNPAGVFAAKVAGRKHFTATRVADDATDFQIAKEAAALFPEHEVVQVDRTSKADEGLQLLLMRHQG